MPVKTTVRISTVTLLFNYISYHIYRLFVNKTTICSGYSLDTVIIPIFMRLFL